MKYVYELTFKGGAKSFTTQAYKFTKEEILNAFKTNGVVKAKFKAELKEGYHICGCGNITKGNKDELCEECREIYGHMYEHEL